MNDFILVGKIINTFGIKGELKISSMFEYKERIFKEDFPIYIGINKVKELISTHRFHKNHDLILFKGYSNINEVLKYKGENIYIKRSELPLRENEYLYQDLIGFKVYEQDEYLGIITDYEENNQNILFKVSGTKTFYLPNIDVYIQEINLLEKKIITHNGKQLII